MRSVSSILLNTPLGLIRPITARKFIELIPRKEWYSYSDKFGYYRHKMDNPFFFERERMFQVLIKTPVRVTDLLFDLPVEQCRKYDLMEMIEDITIESACMMANPTHLVRLDKRLWMAANPEDFMVYFNDYGQALVNLKPYKSIVWSVDRTKKYG